MIRITLLLMLLTYSVAYSQSNTITDTRDNSVYRITDINGTLWMIDNLKFVAEKSTPINQEKIAENDLQDLGLEGRYYHLEELDEVCPSGWRLPNVDDWFSYLKYLAAKEDPPLELELVTVEKPYHHYVSNYEGKIDLFEEGNPLNLIPTGRIEGGNQNIPTIYADYWTIDKNESAEGRTHAHLVNTWTTIHSHNHHLKTWQKKKLRLFMVRCVK